MTSLLDERELSGDERQAVADEPRPGVWIEHGPDGDGRSLSQEDTDALIGRELYRCCQTNLLGMLTSIAGPLREIRFDLPGPMGSTRAIQQRGGISSDPLVRLLAYRAWGERDRQWETLILDGAHHLLSLLPHDPTPGPQHAGHIVSEISKRFDGDGMSIDFTCSCRTRFSILVEVQPNDAKTNWRGLLR